MLSIKTLLIIHVVSLLIKRQPILKIKHKNNFFNLSLHNTESCHVFPFDFMRVATFDLALALTLWRL
jgi:hypothetical protein